MYRVMLRDNMSPRAKEILEATGQIQVVVEGVGFDQLGLSPARFLNEPPTVAVVQPQE